MAIVPQRYVAIHLVGEANGALASDNKEEIKIIEIKSFTSAPWRSKGLGLRSSKLFTKLGRCANI